MHCEITCRLALRASFVSAVRRTAGGVNLRRQLNGNHKWLNRQVRPAGSSGGWKVGSRNVTRTSRGSLSQAAAAAVLCHYVTRLLRLARACQSIAARRYPTQPRSLAGLAHVRPPPLPPPCLCLHPPPLSHTSTHARTRAHGARNTYAHKHTHTYMQSRCCLVHIVPCAYLSLRCASPPPAYAHTCPPAHTPTPAHRSGRWPVRSSRPARATCSATGRRRVSRAGEGGGAGRGKGRGAGFVGTIPMKEPGARGRMTATWWDPGDAYAYACVC